MTNGRTKLALLLADLILAERAVDRQARNECNAIRESASPTNVKLIVTVKLVDCKVIMAKITNKIGTADSNKHRNQTSSLNVGYESVFNMFTTDSGSAKT
ncbi:hypothetical protein PTQ19_13510 [Microbacterium esteraromaticum]|uniref:hypothetical protein n=1 Tax=Microbacterium esteraromaticum TaxID=57043 RepID=UPI002367D715|nr:hypothetical protein [Microbacterium esteraromaticum]WDH78517.1 hypothetical protein PTQ19_13510 [Microbacterium esteraromaticum]